VTLDPDEGIAEKEVEIVQIVIVLQDATVAVTAEIAIDAMIGISSQNAKMFMNLFTLTFRKIRTKPVSIALKCLLMLRVTNFFGTASNGSLAIENASPLTLVRHLLRIKFKISLVKARRTTSKWLQIVEQFSLITFL
jgi:hypothetical protein